MAAPAPPSYRPAEGAVDEAFEADGGVRPPYAPVLDALYAAEPAHVAATVTSAAARDAFVCDAFGAREAFAAGVVPADLLDDCPWFERDVAELPGGARRIAVAGPDIVRNERGELVVLEDNVRTPTLMTF